MIDEIAKQILQALEKFEIKKIDDYLDLRDKKPFDKNWENAHNVITACMDNNDLDFQNQEAGLRELIFKKVAKQMKHYELAEYISDDAGLIFANQYFEANNEFANQLLESYKSGNLPK